MVLVEHAQLWFFLFALFPGERAARVELAARRWIGRRRDFALELLPTLAIVRVKRGNGRQQRARIGMTRPAEQLVRRRRFDQPSQIHHRDMVADMRDHAQIVADEQEGYAEIALEALEQVEYVGLDRDVERRDGLVGHHEARIGYERACDRDTLALAA